MDLTDNIMINTHSSIRIAGSKVLYFDPFEITQASADADVIFVTHEHYDHFDPQSIGKIKKDNTVLVAPETMKKKVLAESGIPEANCVFCVPEEKYEIAGLSVKAIRAYNLLKPFHMKSKDWLGYIVNLDGVEYYVAGDTDANEDVKKVTCDVALLPIGGLYTMDKQHAAELVKAIRPKAVVPTHYGNLIGDPSDGPDFKALVEQAGASEVILKL